MKTIPDTAVDTIVIHYSATPIERSFTAGDIDRMHRARGFDKIGYHFFIRRDGTVETGRRIDLEGRIEQGAHVRGHNDHSIGICYEGGVHADDLNTGFDTRTPDQIDALISLIDALRDRFPRVEIRSHRDMPGAATQCPGFDAGAWWKTVEIERSRTWLTRFIASLATLVGRKTA
jgi:N-acetylmuramoyl-L-alanine amidase